MIFKILEIRKMTKEAKENPGKFASAGIGDLFLGLFLIPIISAILFLTLFFILGYTTFLGGPFGFFKFLFLLLLFGAILLFFTLKRVYSALRRVTKNTVNETIKVESKLKDEI